MDKKVFISFEGKSKIGYDYTILKTNNYEITQHKEYKTSIGNCNKFFDSIHDAITYICRYKNNTYNIIIE